ncbi:hypothetical protein LSUB1_G000311 [Lachnellula subtilissima]|uniref:Uncharacterized protein n=1 Tax=Lachnellula subtilissima TaxID=602034 RepID=A0A8H8S4R6_9HELO|nr:hypothetical protein LSUB1_G000311 [Lachnellula subtilissima]
MEANSLSDITQLASNPPKYPRNPTEQQRKPLTLYLERVPGTRDIILTTLRPLLKNVTAEDIASSLYYLHLNTEDDLRFLEEDDAAMPEETQSLAASLQKPLPRKPLPESARSSLDQPNPLAKPSTTLSNRDGTSVGLTGNRPSATEAKLSIPRRPLGPRPQQTEKTFERKPLPGAENTLLVTSQDQTLHPRVSRDSAKSYKSQNLVFENAGKPSQSSYDAFSITIIRRDPSSGSQWNVGTVSGRPTLDDGNDRQGKSSSPSKKPYFDMSIQLTSPGYTYFRNSQPVGSLGDITTMRGQSSAPNSIRDSLDAGRSQALPSQSFDREIRMEGSSFWTRQHQRGGSDASSKQGARGRSFSGSSFTEALANTPLGPGGDPNNSSSKGYVFYSPWNGRCKFSTGGAGRTLRCKHSLPNPTTTTESLATAHSSATVSELRFNLPAAAVFASAKSAIKKEFKDSGLSAKIGHMRNKLSSEKAPLDSTPRPHSTSYAATYPSDDDERPPLPPRLNHDSFVADSSDEGERPPLPERPNAASYAADSWVGEDDSRLDLSLGQEKAGGGNRGKRAKLGKLIIYDEGFKMLDLVVAANIGIWWSVWVGFPRSDFQSSNVSYLPRYPTRIKLI